MSKVTEKFQITIPKEVRIAMNISPGIDLIFQKDNEKYYLSRNMEIDPIEKWRGALKSEKSTDELMKDIRGYGIESID